MSYRPKRDKTISLKVNSELLDKFNEIVASQTRRWEYAGKAHYDCSFSGGFACGKFSIADLLEKALKDFIETNSIQK